MKVKVTRHTQFKDSAYRHLVACKQMLKDSKSPQCKSGDKKYLESEAYYLSGYIVELMLSYSVCSYLKIHQNCEDSDPFTKDKNRFKIHNLKLKYQYALDKGCLGLRGLVLLSRIHENDDVQKLFDNWDITYRYVPSNNLPFQSLNTYIDVLENLYQTILKKYPI